jgi:hypothetical protein
MGIKDCELEHEVSFTDHYLLCFLVVISFTSTGVNCKLLSSWHQNQLRMKVFISYTTDTQNFTENPIKNLEHYL